MKIQGLAALLFFLIAANEAKVMEKCEVAKILKSHDMDGFHGASLGDWVCMAHYESGFNTAAVGPPNTDGSQDFGIFQINSKYWCAHNKLPSHNGCNTNCNSFLNDDITDDIVCAKRIIQDPNKMNAWVAWVRNCKGKDLSEWTRGCNLITGGTARAVWPSSRLNGILGLFSWGTMLRWTALVLEICEQVLVTGDGSSKFPWAGLPQHLIYFLPNQRGSSTSDWQPIKAPVVLHVATTVEMTTHDLARLLLLLLVAQNGAIVLDRCSLAAILKENGMEGFAGGKVADWVCLVAHSSRFNTSAIRVGPKATSYGLFLFSGRWWCEDFKTPVKRNKCNLLCDALCDDDITDDINCAKKVVQATGLWPWVEWRKHCQGKDLSQYVVDCER
ncbi:uncharacterized protein LOC143831233 [Paroedura picta]|uniref:uncharacterized protein LOC143831233 n=1 Tax=Paroedura picta TaxID=143630 RepID=UPI0040561E4A